MNTQTNCIFHKLGNLFPTTNKFWVIELSRQVKFINLSIFYYYSCTRHETTNPSSLAPHWYCIGTLIKTHLKEAF